MSQSAMTADKISLSRKIMAAIIRLGPLTRDGVIDELTVADYPAGKVSVAGSIGSLVERGMLRSVKLGKTARCGRPCHTAYAATSKGRASYASAAEECTQRRADPSPGMPHGIRTRLQTSAKTQDGGFVLVYEAVDYPGLTICRRRESRDHPTIQTVMFNNQQFQSVAAAVEVANAKRGTA